MSKLVLWHVDVSPPCWTVRIMAQILGLKLELKAVDFVTKEHKDPAFKKVSDVERLFAVNGYRQLQVSYHHVTILFVLNI